ncbi:MAG: hypothetical protein H8E83_08500 [Planctomycetes bacterium]|nr:hypothetical protein [Planctomycetota bacterium]
MKGEHEGIWLLCGVSGTRLQFRNNTDARLKKDIVTAKEWWMPFINTLRNSEFQRITVLPTGNVRNWNA